MDGHTVIDLHISQGNIDLEPLLLVWAHPQSSKVALLWKKALADCIVLDRRFVGLEALMSASVKVHALQSLFVQLAWGFSVELERQMGAAGIYGCALGRLTFSWNGIADGDIGLGAERMLAQYNAAGITALSRQHVFGITTDKSTIARLPMQLTCIVAPTGVVVLAPPGVPHIKIMIAATLSPCFVIFLVVKCLNFLALGGPNHLW